MTQMFSCMIIDDEPDAVELLIARLNYLFSNVKVEGAYTSWEEALAALRRKTPQILFQDISMPGKNGIDFLKLLPEIDSEIIFTTAHAEFAIEAFKLSATGYVLKPIDDVELSKTVNKAIERIKLKINVQTNKHKPSSIKIGIPGNKGTDYVNITDILYLEAINKCTKIVTPNNEYLSSYSIGKFKSIIEDGPFCQVHRSFIVNLNYIIRYESTGGIIMSDKKEIPVSKSMKDEFISLFSQFAKMVHVKPSDEE